MGFRRKTRGLLRYLYITIQYDTQKAAISAPYNVPLALQSLSQPLSTNNLETSSCEWSCSASSPIRQENLSGNISFLDSSLIVQLYARNTSVEAFDFLIIHLYARNTSVETFHFLTNRNKCATLMREVQTILFETNVMGQLWLSRTWRTEHSEAENFFDLHFGAFTTRLTSKPWKPDRHKGNERPDQ